MLQRYTAPPNPEAYSGRGNVARRNNISQPRAAHILARNEAYTLHRRFRRPALKNPYYTMYLRQFAQMDLIDKLNLAQFNDGYSYILVCIDCFSRKLFARKILSKASAHMIPAMRSILDEMGQLPEQILADRGSEMKSAAMRRLLREKNITLMHPSSEVKAGIIERSNQSTQSLLYKYLSDNETRRWIDALDVLVETYNSRPHSSIDFLSPNSAENPNNSNRVASALRQHYSKGLDPSKKNRFRVGDKVRLKTGYGMAFARGFEEQFSRELYTVDSINNRMKTPMYRIRSLDSGRLIAGGCYAEELQLVRGDVVRFTVVGRRVNRRTGRREMRIHWRGFSDNHDEWVPETMPVVANFQPLPQQLRQPPGAERGGR